MEIINVYRGEGEESNRNQFEENYRFYNSCTY